MSDETTLLPCPFCGGEADEYEGDFGNGVYCMNCGAMIGEPIHMEYRVTERVSIGQAIEAWNTRARESELEEKLVMMGEAKRTAEKVVSNREERIRELEQLVREMDSALIHGNCYRWCKLPCNLIDDGKCNFHERMKALGIDTEGGA